MIDIVAPAKINLFLHIIGRRSDNYHLLESIFAFTEFGDRLSFAPSDNITLKISGPFAGPLNNPLNKDNLIIRAANLLQKKAVISRGAHIELSKQIPISAGIGGGSADAAATLQGLNKLWELNLTLDELAELAILLGADVPACLYHQPVFVQGIGELITPLQSSLPYQWVVLVNPMMPLSTPAVFKQYYQVGCSFSHQLNNVQSADSSKLLDLLNNTTNDLEHSALSLLPMIQTILDNLKNQEGVLLTRMSGSGPTCFAFFASEISAKKATQALKDIFPSFWFTVTRLI